MITLTDSQAAAVKAIVKWYGEKGRQEFYFAGFAGVGKSTVVAFAIEELRAKYRKRIKNVLTATFTGKAAYVLRRKGVKNTSTIHKGIYRVEIDEATGRPHFFLDLTTAPAAEADLIVLDEVSMVNEAMAADVRAFGKKMLVVGDPGQLPPVRGLGAFTNREPDVFLTEIHRQALESPIIRIATMARQRQPIPVGEYGDNVRVLTLDGETQNFVYDPDTQPICGVHKVRWTITQRLRKRLGFEGPLPEVGERIICRKNDHELGIFNGQQGYAMSKPEELWAGGEFVFNAKLDDTDYVIDGLNVDPWLFRQHFAGPSMRPRINKGTHEFDWGSVLTGHSAQGSEWPHVTVVDDSAAFREDAPRWLYTTLTRPSDGLILLKRSA